MATTLKIKDATKNGSQTKTANVVKKRVTRASNTTRTTGRVKKVVKKRVAKKAAVTKKAKKTTKRVAKKATKKTTKKATKRTTKATAKKATGGKTMIAAKVINRDQLFKQRKPQPLGHLLVEQKLREAGFRGEVSSDRTLLEQYSTDESIFAVQPQIVLQPKTGKDVETAVRVLSAETKRFPTLSLTPRAAGTGLSGGSLTDSIVIDVSKHLTNVHDIIKGTHGVTFTAEPGVMWRDMEKELKKHAVYVPSYPASKDICSLGGAVGNNASGPD